MSGHCVITLFRFTRLRARSFLDAEGICRLCRRQATLLHRDDRAASWEEVRTGAQQLYITGLFRSSVFTPRRLPPRPHPIPPPAHQQLVLFDMARSLHHRGGAERLVADRAEPHLAAWVAQFTDRQTARLGWRRDLTRQAHIGVNFLLGLLDASGVRLSATDAALLKKIPYLPHAHVTDILEEAGLLARTEHACATTAWAQTRIAHLPKAMQAQVEVWLAVMRDGTTRTPRQRPRTQTTIRLHLAGALPALTHWAQDGITPRHHRK